MMTAAFLRKRSVLLSLFGILLLGGVVWGVTARARTRENALRNAAAQAAPQDLNALFQAARESLGRKDLPREQRDQIWENLRSARKARKEQRMNEYFLATPDKRQSILDRHLDESQQWYQLQAQREQSRALSSSPGPSNVSNAGGSGHHERTREERKMHSESRSPDRRARKMAYESALRGRASQRGIQMR